MFSRDSVGCPPQAGLVRKDGLAARSADSPLASPKQATILADRQCWNCGNFSKSVEFAKRRAPRGSDCNWGHPQIGLLVLRRNSVAATRGVRPNHRQDSTLPGQATLWVAPFVFVSYCPLRQYTYPPLGTAHTMAARQRVEEIFRWFPQCSRQFLRNWGCSTFAKI